MDGKQEIRETIIQDDIILLNPGKALDNDNAHKMVDIISSSLKRGFKYIIVNMSELQLLSSAGVGSIIGTVETVREKGGDILLCNIPPNIKHILDILDLSDYLTIYSNKEEAMATCGV